MVVVGAMSDCDKLTLSESEPRLPFFLDILLGIFGNSKSKPLTEKHRVVKHKPKTSFVTLYFES